MRLSTLLTHCMKKRVHILCHWDCDGVSSAAIVYHLLKNMADVSYESVGMRQDSVSRACLDADVIITVDIEPIGLDTAKVICIDHHEWQTKDDFLELFVDTSSPSCSMMLYNELGIADDYLKILVILGFFGDGHKFEELFQDLKNFLHPMQSLYPFVSLFNTAKRVDWNGQKALTILCEIDSIEDFYSHNHPLFAELQENKEMLVAYYTKTYTSQICRFGTFIRITEPYNIQGVLCEKRLSEVNEPVLVMNEHQGFCVGSLRTTEESDISAREFIQKALRTIPNAIGGGHDRAAGFSFPKEYESVFLTNIGATKE